MNKPPWDTLSTPRRSSWRLYRLWRNDTMPVSLFYAQTPDKGFRRFVWATDGLTLVLLLSVIVGVALLLP